MLSSLDAKLGIAQKFLRSLRPAQGWHIKFALVGGGGDWASFRPPRGAILLLGCPDVLYPSPSSLPPGVFHSSPSGAPMDFIRHHRVSRCLIRYHMGSDVLSPPVL